jgi:hypothetical protein
MRRALPLALCLLVPPAQAARPMITDDARIVDAKSCQLESWVSKSRHSTLYWALPACNFTGDLELTAGGARAEDDSGTGTSDFVLQGKTLFRRLQTNGWGTGLAVGADHHPRLGAGGRDWYAYVPTSFSFADDRFLLHTNLGWLREQQSGRDRLTWGLGSETQLTRETWLIAETFGKNQGRPFFQAGLRHWLITDRMQIDATFGNRFGQMSEERWFSIGLRLLSAPFLP